MASHQPSILPPGAGPRYFVLGDLVTGKVHGRETGGVFFGKLSPEEQGDFPRVDEMAARYGVEFPPNA